MRASKSAGAKRAHLELRDGLLGELDRRDVRAPQRRDERQVLPRAKLGKRIGGVGNVTELRLEARFVTGQTVSQEPSLSPIGPEEAPQHAQERRLPRAILSHDDRGLAFAYFERHSA